jgi:hypothetical protein
MWYTLKDFHPSVQSRSFLVPQILTKKLMKHNIFLKFWCCIFVRGIMPFPLVKIFGYEGWSYDNVFHVIFPSCFALVEAVFPTMVTKTMKLHLFPHLIEVTTTFVETLIFKCPKAMWRHLP